MGKKLRVLIVGMILIAGPFLLGSVLGAQEQKGSETITIWKGSWWADQGPVLEKEFAIGHKNRIDIKTFPFDGLIEKYITAIAGGQAPDIIAVDNNMLPLLISRNLLQPIPGIDKSDFSGAFWEAASANGKLYGVPYRADTSGVFYNKAMFKEAGIAEPAWNWTWDDFLKTAKRLTKGESQYGFGISGSSAAATDFEAEILPMIWAFGGDVIKDGKMALNEPGAIAGLQYWVDLLKKHHVSPSGAVNYDNKDYIEFFLNGRVAMMMGGSNVIPLLKTRAKNIDWDFVQIPGGVSKGFGEGYCIPVGAKHAAAAREYIEWFTEPKTLSRLTIRMPARASAATSAPWSDPMYVKVMKAATNSKSPPMVSKWVQIRAVMIQEMQKVLTGSTESVQKAVEIINVQGNALLK